MRRRRGDWRGVAHAVAIVVALASVGAACADDVPGSPAGSGTAPPATDVPAVGSVPPPTVATATSRPTTSVANQTGVASVVSTAPPGPTAAPAPPPTIADQFASSLGGLEVRLFGTAVPPSARDAVARLWLLLGRPPTADELRSAVEAVVAEGEPLDAVADLLLGSPEVVVAASGVQPDEFVAGLYDGMFDRSAEPAEIDGWVGRMNDGMSPAEVAVWLAESPEAVSMTATTSLAPMPAVYVPDVDRAESDSVLRLYLGLLGRFPTSGELVRDVSRFTDDVLLATIADDVLASAEYRSRQPDSDPAAILTALHLDVLGSVPSQTALISWVDLVQRGSSPGQLAVVFTESPVFVSRTGTTAPPVGTSTARPPATGAIDGLDTLAIGDSIMLSASNALSDVFPGITIDAAVGRQFSEGLSIVRSRVREGDIPGTVIVHLGTNGTVSADGCDELMTLLAGRRVILVNVRVPRPWEAPNNDVLTACADRHAAQLVDWHANATNLATDGYHLGGGGPDEYASTIASRV